MWYVFVWNFAAEGLECIGAYSREDDAKALFEKTKAEWNDLPKGDRPNTDFSGSCSFLTWSEFCESLFHYRLREVAEPIKFLARGHGWEGDQGGKIRSK